MKQFYKSIEDIITSHADIKSQVKLIRDNVKEALSLDKFRINCIESVLDTMDSCLNKDLQWHSPEIYNNEKLGYSVRIVFWPAFYENNPHQHKTWSVTGIFHNKLNVNTFEMLENPARLRRDRLITAAKGEVGYLLPGCIHNVSNISHELSASFHIFNNIPGIASSEENAIWYPAPRKHNLSSGLIDRALAVCLSVAENIYTQQAFDVIDRIYHLSSLSIKLMAVKSLYKFDRIYAEKLLNNLVGTF